jgi:hypothetical protein
MGTCAVCGESFAAGVLKDLCGMPSGIKEFSVGFSNDTLYAHDPECVDKIKEAFDSGDPQAGHDKLPDGPLKKCLDKALKIREATP